ncbi:MAG: thioesterase family protein, partial [Acidobacteriota bacterium]
VLGLKVDSLALERSVLSFETRPEHIGNFARGILHGGVISAVLDTTGGLVAYINALERVQNLLEEDRLAILTRIGTIDLRVDYLQVARGKGFRATGQILRTGSRVAVTRMELHDARDELVATGTGTYMIS